jgi:glyoxylase-like metal-dependent hydrolase (beta-lactamase superfamily II)
MSDYSIWVLEYSFVPNYHISALIYGAHNQGYRKLPYCYVLIKGKGHIAMVDVGYNATEYGDVLAGRFGVTNWHSPEHVLQKCDVKPEDVDSIFVTHGHFDHFGNVDAFPNAKVYIQEREISKWVWAMSLPERMQWMMGAVDPGDILRGVKLAQEGRLVCVDGDLQDVLPGIDLHLAYDTHTAGSMYVTVRNDGEKVSQDAWVLAGDLIYVYENLGQNSNPNDNINTYCPIGFAQGSQTNLVLTTEEIMKSVNYEWRRVIPVHEERIKDEFPSIIGDDGLRVSEICIGKDQVSRVG